MSQPIRFGSHAPSLHANGWDIIPIPRGSKAPLIDKWPAGFATPQIAAFAANGYAQGNIGLLARAFPGVDIDIVDEDCAAAIEKHALRTLGTAPVRFGRRPKRLLVYRTAAPFKKIKVYLAAPDGSTKGADGKAYAVEILGDGQQYVIYGEHPDGFDYSWPGNDGPTVIAPSALSLINKAMVSNFLEELPAALPAGWVVCNSRRGGPSGHKAAVTPQFEHLRQPLPDWPLKRIVAELLSHLDPDMGHDDWLKTGMALHHQGRGDEEYKEAWKDWSAPSDKFKEGECDVRWASFSAHGNGGQAPVTLASLIQAVKNARMSHARATRHDLETRIQAASDFDELTKQILKAVFEANLPEADTALLLKKISQKTKVSVKSLTLDGAHYRRVGASNQQMHLAAARSVIDLLGRENLLFTRSCLWRWSEAGVWAPMVDREVKQIIHQVAANPSLTTNVVNSILDMVKTEVHRDDIVFDAHKAYINCINGELQYLDFLECWVLRPHDRAHFWTMQIPLNYEPSAEAPRFELFLEEVFAGDKDATQKRLVLEEALGYTLLASCHLEKFFLLIGNGANGKSVLLAVVEALVGPKLVSAVQPNQFDNRFQRGHLVGKLANIVTEIAQGAEIADDKLKALVSGELTTAERKFEDPFDFKPIATHWLGTNHLPRTRDFSHALFRRSVIVTFNNRFEGDRRDVSLTSKLLVELPGIFNIALRGLARLLERGQFTECPSSDTAKDEWRLETDQVQQFVQARCVADGSARTGSGMLFYEYRAWGHEAGIQRTLSRNSFSNRLQVLGFVPVRGGGGERQFAGLRLNGSHSSG